MASSTVSDRQPRIHYHLFRKKNKEGRKERRLPKNTMAASSGMA